MVGQLLLGILLGMGADDGGVDEVMQARSICGAASEESRIRLQVDMQTFDHGIQEAGVLVGFFGQCLQCLRMMAASDVVGLKMYHSLKRILCKSKVLRYICFAATRLDHSKETNPRPTPTRKGPFQAAGRLQRAELQIIVSLGNFGIAMTNFGFLEVVSKSFRSATLRPALKRSPIF